MKIPRRTLKWAGALVALVLALVGIHVLRVGGAFHSVDSAFAGQCRAIALAGSSEDIRLDRERGLAYLSVLDRDSAARGDAVNGSVLLLDLNLADPAPRAAMTFDPANFRPLGLSLYKAGADPAKLFAISRQADGSATVEIAEQGTSGGFFPKETIHDAAFVNANAIAAVGPREFYLVNESTIAGRWARVKETLFRSGSGTLVHFDGTRARIEATGLDYSAGLAASPDGTRLYVAETMAKALRIYQRDAASGALSLLETVDLGTSPDNLDVDGEGVLWIAAHPKLLRFVGHLRNSAEHAPTQVLRFDPRQNGDARLTQVYLNTGEEISAGTVATRWRDEFLIGALLDKKVLICKPKT